MPGAAASCSPPRRSSTARSGERNLLSFQGRGVFACISPWNFPLAIFTGQVTAALMAGNAVVAKPAPATTLVAHAMTRLLHEAGIPRDVLQLAPADGPLFGATALTHPALAGVAFTGSTATATTINRTLAGREGPIVPLIAETGGVNAMIVDATALPEQVVDDVIASAFTSAGQRCSALRMLYLQEEVADRVLEMLIGAMKCLTIGDPADPATDVGPVISGDAQQRLQRHAERMTREAKLLYACPVEHCEGSGHFFGPRLFELDSPDQLKTEEFGPILHVFRYRAEELGAGVGCDPRDGVRPDLGRAQPAREHGGARLPYASGRQYVRQPQHDRRGRRRAAVRRSGAVGHRDPRRVARITCSASPRSGPSPSTPRRSAAQWNCSQRAVNSECAQRLGQFREGADGLAADIAAAHIGHGGAPRRLLCDRRRQVDASAGTASTIRRGE